MKELEESTLKKFTNLYWTRVIPLHDFKPDLIEKFEIGPDVADELDKLFRIDADALPEW